MRLENWYICSVYKTPWEGQNFEGTLHICGNIHGDSGEPRKDGTVFTEGEYIRTSVIQSVKSLTRVATMNSIYDLGKPADDKQPGLLALLLGRITLAHQG